MKNCPTFKELLQSANPVYRFKHVFKLATTIMFLCEKPLINLDPIHKAATPNPNIFIRF